MPVSSSGALAVRPSPSDGGRARAFVRRLKSGDEIAYAITFLSAVAVLVITALLVYELYRNSEPSRVKFGWSFLWTKTWDPVAG